MPSILPPNCVNITLNPRTRSGIMGTQSTKIRLKEMSQYNDFWHSFIEIRKCFSFRSLYSKIFWLMAYSIVFIIAVTCEFVIVMKLYVLRSLERPIVQFFRSLTESFFIAPCVLRASSEILRHARAILFHRFRLPDPLKIRRGFIRGFSSTNTANCFTDPKKYHFKTSTYKRSPKWWQRHFMNCSHL